MSFQQKNSMVSLLNFSLILIFFSIRVVQFIQNQSFTESNVFRLWGITIVLSVIVTILATILTHIVFTILTVIKTGNRNPEIEDFADERDKLIDLRGTRVTYFVSSGGGFLAMLSFVLGQPPLVMFTLLIFFGLVAQVVGDARRQLLYQRGL